MAMEQTERPLVNLTAHIEEYLSKKDRDLVVEIESDGESDLEIELWS